MVSRKDHKAIVSFLESHGFEYVRTNSKGFEFFRRGDWEESISPSIGDGVARQMRARVERRLGIATAKDRSKRDVATVKLRRAGDRERAAAEVAAHEAEIDRLVARRKSRLDGLGAVLSSAQLRDIERLIEAKARDLRYWQSLMTTVPSVNAHAGRVTAQHRS